MANKLKEVKKDPIKFDAPAACPAEVVIFIEDVADFIYEVIDGHPDANKSFILALNAASFCSQAQDLLNKHYGK